MSHKSAFKIWEVIIFKQKIDSCEIEVCLCFKLLKIFKAVHKNNLQTHSQSQNKKAVLTTAGYFKVCTSDRTVAETGKKRCFWYETEKVNTIIQFYIFESI